METEIIDGNPPPPPSSSVVSDLTTVLCVRVHMRVLMLLGHVAVSLMCGTASPSAL